MVKGPKEMHKKAISLSMFEDIKNSTIINHKYIYLSLSMFIHKHAKDVAYIIFLKSHKHLKTQEVIHSNILPSCPQGFDSLLRK